MFAFFSQAQILNSASFADRGYPDFTVDGKNKLECTEYVFLRDLNITTEEQPYKYTMLSLHVGAFPVSKGLAEVSVYINDNDQNNVFKKLDLKRNPKEWYRMVIPADLLGTNNTIKVCAQTTEEITKLQIFSDSLISTHLMPDFEATGAFTIETSDPKPVVGEQFKVIVVLKNYGSEGTTADLRYRKEQWDEFMPTITFIKGPTSYQKEMPACIQRDAGGNCTKPSQFGFEYIVKANKPVEMTFIPAVVSFINDFGEETTVQSSTAKIKARLPERNLSSFFIASKENISDVPAGTTVPFTLGIKNESMDPALDVLVAVDFPGEIMVQGKQSNVISEIKPKETVYLSYEVKSANPGKYSLGCMVRFMQFPETISKCDVLDINFVQPAVSPMIILGIVLLLAGAAVFGYINYVRK